MYIARTLTIAKGTRDERLATEDEVAGFGGPIILLGEPGLGKTELTRSLAVKLGALRVSAGQFQRTQALDRITPETGQLLIIDGLDEITASVGSAVDEVLGKLSVIGYPPFMLSCRSMDWEGALGRHKIEEDYGVPPLVLHLEPLSIDDARAFLSGRLGAAKNEALIEAIRRQRLEALAGNPLTLKLLAELAEDGQDVPRTRGELFERAAPLLLKEENKAHARRGPASLPSGVLLDAAGAIFAHLLLSGMSGVAIGTSEETADNFVPEAEILALGADGFDEVMRTRLFRAETEHLVVPIHKLIAEYLAGKWLATRISRGLSKRRALQAFSSVGGVPAALRGMHAWLACACPAVAEDCIKVDPYGILRYGDAGRLSPPHVRALLRALSALAVEDPYFRSEDWGVAAVSGLARVELKDEILQLVTSSSRPLHLSTLLLEAMKGTDLARAVKPILLEMMRSEGRPYVERRHAVENLAAGNLVEDWSAEIRAMLASNSRLNRRMALEILQHARDPLIPGDLIADALIGYHGLDREEKDRISGIDYGLERKLSHEQMLDALDALGDLFARQQERESHWNPHHRLCSIMMTLLRRALESAPNTPPERIWRWVRCIDCRRCYRDADRDAVRSFFETNKDTRRAIQRLAFAKPSMGETPWMAIVHDLPEVSPGLGLTTADAGFYLGEIANSATPGPAEINLWSDIVQSLAPRRGIPDELKSVVESGVTLHDVLAEHWHRILQPPERDWEKEHAAEREQAARKRAERYVEHRESFQEVADDIEIGKATGALNRLATAYLGLYSDFSTDLSPRDRLVEWVGEDIANRAERGFVALLARSDLPTAKEIVETRLEGQQYHTALPMICGAVLMHQDRNALDGLANETLTSLLVEWWDMADVVDRDLRSRVQQDLEDIVLVSETDLIQMARLLVEPWLKVGSDEIHVLNMLRHHERFDRVLADLALEWLSDGQAGSSKVQAELLELALERGRSNEVAKLITARLPVLREMPPDARRDWAAAGFASDTSGADAEVTELAQSDPKLLWSIRRFITARASRDTSSVVVVAKRGLIVRLFSTRWPPSDSPVGGWVGDNNPHQATEYIVGNLDALGADASNEAGNVLDQLVIAPETAAYHEHIRHMRAQQRRARRDREYIASSFAEIRSTLQASAPGTIDDLKALMLDAFAEVQKYIRDGDTRGWEKFWSGGRPLDEDGCRNRLLDDLRPRTDSIVTLLPESLMPERKRVDILALHEKKGLPIEIKGQWHDDVWDAASTQLEGQYTRDWRASGRGIYLVFWFGPDSLKKLTPHPDALAPPSSPDEMKQMLEARLSASERARIDVVVFDGSAA